MNDLSQEVRWLESATFEIEDIPDVGGDEASWCSSSTSTSSCSSCSTSSCCSCTSSSCSSTS